MRIVTDITDIKILAESLLTAVGHYIYYYYIIGIPAHFSRILLFSSGLEVCSVPTLGPRWQITIHKHMDLLQRITALINILLLIGGTNETQYRKQIHILNNNINPINELVNCTILDEWEVFLDAHECVGFDRALV
ncbi:hypothetical protein ACJX0J_031649 [Zea mays]